MKNFSKITSLQSETSTAQYYNSKPITPATVKRGIGVNYEGNRFSSGISTKNTPLRTYSVKNGTLSSGCKTYQISSNDVKKKFFNFV